MLIVDEDAFRGALADAAAAEGRIDAVFLDLRTPGSDGPDARVDRACRPKTP